MNISALCQSLDFNQLTIDTVEKLKASLDQQSISITDYEADTKYGNLELTLSHKTAQDKCYLSISNNVVYINPIGNFGNDQPNFNLKLNDQRSIDDWVKIAMAFILDAVWIKEPEFCFEIFNEDGDLIHDCFKTKSLAHALFKAKNTDTLSNLNPDDVYEVVINIENDDGSSQITYKKHKDFFALCDHQISNDNLILALMLIETSYSETTYSKRINRPVGVEL